MKDNNDGLKKNVLRKIKIKEKDFSCQTSFSLLNEMRINHKKNQSLSICSSNKNISFHSNNNSNSNSNIKNNLHINRNCTIKNFKQMRYKPFSNMLVYHDCLTSKRIEQPELSPQEKLCLNSFLNANITPMKHAKFFTLPYLSYTSNNNSILSLTKRHDNKPTTLLAYSDIKGNPTRKVNVLLKKTIKKQRLCSLNDIELNNLWNPDNIQKEKERDMNNFAQSISNDFIKNSFKRSITSNKEKLLRKTSYMSNFSKLLI